MVVTWLTGIGFEMFCDGMVNTSPHVGFSSRVTLRRTGFPAWTVNDAGWYSPPLTLRSIVWTSAAVAAGAGASVAVGAVAVSVTTVSVVVCWWHPRVRKSAVTAMNDFKRDLLRFVLRRGGPLV